MPETEPLLCIERFPLHLRSRTAVGSNQLVSSEVQDDQFEQVPGAVGSDEQVMPGILAQLDPGDRVGPWVLDVLFGDAMAPS
jgi:hypothetical protein